MSAKPATRIHGASPDAIRRATALVQQAQSVQIDLPPDLHHAVFVRLYPDSRPGEHEHIDEQGGPALLERLAAIRSLSSLNELVEPARRLGASVRLTSPSPKITIGFDALSTAAPPQTTDDQS